MEMPEEDKNYKSEKYQIFDKALYDLKQSRRQ